LVDGPMRNALRPRAVAAVAAAERHRHGPASAPRGDDRLGVGPLGRAGRDVGPALCVGGGVISRAAGERSVINALGAMILDEAMLLPGLRLLEVGRPDGVSRHRPQGRERVVQAGRDSARRLDS
jgi:hypothetical protein